MESESAFAPRLVLVLASASVAAIATIAAPRLVASDSGREIRPREAFAEDLGPRFGIDWTDPASPERSGNAHHWTRLVGVPFTRDVHIDLRGVALDLDGDGRTDTTVTRKIDLAGGMFANPEAFGLVATPDDPAGSAGRQSISFGWIRVAPLRGASATAPYLHNGSVPALRDLLERPERRPRTFAVGNAAQAFVLDTSLPGNRNAGHVYGTDLSDDEKDALVEFLMSL